MAAVEVLEWVGSLRRKSAHPVFRSTDAPFLGDLFGFSPEGDAVFSGDVGDAEFRVVPAAEGEGFAGDGDADVDADHAGAGLLLKGAGDGPAGGVD